MTTLTPLTILDQLAGEIAWKDKNFAYLGCNSNRAKLLKLKHAEDIIGMSDNDLCDQSTESIAFHHLHDTLAIKGEVIQTIHPSAVTKNSLTYFQIKKPLLIEGKIAGVIYHCVEFSKPQLFTQLQTMDKSILPQSYLPKCYRINDNIPNLTPRELECLFCLLRGMSAKMTGELIHLSKRTVEFYIDNIKNKFSCQNKSELVIKAIDSGYIEIIPKRFLEIDWKSYLIQQRL